MRFLCSACRTVLTAEAGQSVECHLCRTKCTAPKEITAPGAVIGDFAIVRELARGGMGIVFLARQLSLDRLVALKILQGAYASDTQFVESFIREARAAARISHPNIVQAYAVGEENGTYYFAMELIDGETMKAVLKKENRIEPRKAAEIIRSVADALDYAWTEQKMVHQDIKPDNIMLTRRGQAKLADLGLARIATGGSNLAEDDDEVMGTPQYISPEQLTGQETDIRSDIYSLGATFYHFVTGEFPYTGKNGDEIARQHVEGTLIPPIQKNPQLPEELNRIIVRMMEKDISKRYQTGAELVTDLKNFLENRTGTAPAAPAVPKTSAPAAPAAPKIAAPAAPKIAAPAAPKIAAPAAPKIAAPAAPKIAAPAAPKIAAPAAPKIAAPAVPKIAAPAVPKIAAPATPKIAAPAAPKTDASAAPKSVEPAASPKDGEKVPSAEKKPEEAAKIHVKPSEPENANGASGDAAKDAPETDPGKKKRRFPAWVKWTLIGTASGMVLLIAVFAVLVWLKKMPAPLLPLQEQVLALLHISGTATNSAAAVPPPEVKKPAPPKSAVPAKPLPPPKPVTRTAYRNEAKQLLQMANQGKIEEFLRQTDEFMRRYPAVLTDEEKALRQQLLTAYGPNDESFRVSEYRNQARSAYLKKVQVKAEAAEKRAQEEARRKAEAERIRAESQSRAKAAEQQAAAEKAEKAAALKARLEQYRQQKESECRKLAGVFFAELGRLDSPRWKECRQAALTVGLPKDAQKQEKDIFGKTSSFAKMLDREFRDAGKLKKLLDDPDVLHDIQIEMKNGDLMDLDHFEKPDQLWVVKATENKKLYLNLQDLRTREMLFRRLMLNPQIAALYPGGPVKTPPKRSGRKRNRRPAPPDPRFLRFSDHLDLYCLNFGHLMKNPQTARDRKAFFERLLELYFQDCRQTMDAAAQNGLKTQYGQLPVFQKVFGK